MNINIISYIYSFSIHNKIVSLYLYIHYSLIIICLYEFEYLQVLWKFLLEENIHGYKGFCKTNNVLIFV